jgi:hypothetical protein
MKRVEVKLVLLLTDESAAELAAEVSTAALEELTDGLDSEAGEQVLSAGMTITEAE